MVINLESKRITRFEVLKIKNLQSNYQVAKFNLKIER